MIELKDIKETIVFYEAPHRIKNTLNLMYKVLGDRNIAIAREISKLHEEIIRNKISNIIELCDKIKGEIVIIVSGNDDSIKDDINYLDKVNELIKDGYTRKDAIKEIADMYNISKNKLYNDFKK